MTCETGPGVSLDHSIQPRLSLNPLIDPRCSFASNMFFSHWVGSIPESWHRNEPSLGVGNRQSLFFGRCSVAQCVALGGRAVASGF